MIENVELITEYVEDLISEQDEKLSAKTVEIEQLHIANKQLSEAVKLKTQQLYDNTVTIKDTRGVKEVLQDLSKPKNANDTVNNLSHLYNILQKNNSQVDRVAPNIGVIISDLKNLSNTFKNESDFNYNLNKYLGDV
jgi:predicted  nucleic acid-binding Zn-ribbon protein